MLLVGISTEVKESPRTRTPLATIIVKASPGTKAEVSTIEKLRILLETVAPLATQMIGLPLASNGEPETVPKASNFAVPKIGWFIELLCTETQRIVQTSGGAV